MKVLFLLLIISINYKAQASVMVVNGKVALHKVMVDNGAVALIYKYGNEEFFGCTGTRIAPDIILTAAHCVIDAYSELIGVRQALKPLDKTIPLEKVEGFKFPEKDYFYNQYFKDPKRNDIALVRLEKKSARPFISISTINSFSTFTDYLLQLGFGKTTHDDNIEEDESKRFLRFLDTGVIAPNHFPSNQDDYEEDIKVHNPLSAVASGDSGGPLLKCSKGSQSGCAILGVLSAGINGVTPYGNSNYVSVLPHLSWIRKAIGQPGFNKDLPLKGQFLDEGNIFQTHKTHMTTMKKICKKMSQKVGSIWNLNADGECIPNDEIMCSKVSGTLQLIWNQEKKKCEYADAD